MIELPVCRWRGPELREGCYGCNSPSILKSGPCVPAAICLKPCPYADQPAPVVVREAPAPTGPCRFLGESLRDENGRAITRECRTSPGFD